MIRPPPGRYPKPDRPVITSPQNPLVKELARLRRHPRRDPAGRMLLDGARAVMLALEAGLRPDPIMLCRERATQEELDAAARAEGAGATVIEASPSAFERAAYGGAPDALLAVAPRPRATLEFLRLPSRPLLLVLEGIEKPGNLGAILRTADASGADGVIVCGTACDPFGPNVVRASRGTLFTVPLAEAKSEDALAWLRARRIPVVAAVPDAPQSYAHADLTAPLALAVGAEHAGLSETWRDAAHSLVSLPMRGRADSLNVSVTCAVLLYEALRQRETH